MIERAERFHISLLAEGIETLEEWKWLQSTGISLGQGYYFGKPQKKPKDELILP
ncbi:EAL domain-containing protein [Halobacillus sp. Marseille-Q1614]|uniref:EAL domain-containing protein n=1 Tax=Halobacillus sp. Marseille-Q1614 TaxID=2709134 RepID=UPI00156F66FC